MACLLPMSGMAQQCIYHAVPGKVVLSIDNNTSERQARESLAAYAKQGLVLESLTSETLLISLVNQPGMSTGRLERVPHVRMVRKARDHVSVLFDGSVTDRYAIGLIASIPGVQIQHVTTRHPREARLRVPAGQEQDWLTRLAALPFVLDAAPDCATAYRAACEKYGGTVVYFGSGRETCRVPEAAVDWRTVTPDRRAECRRSGGKWTVSRDTCNDDCSFDKEKFCWNQISEYCDCGIYKCWYEKRSSVTGAGRQGTCIDNPPWHKRGD